MTCVVSIETEDAIYIASDRAASNNFTIDAYDRPKIFVKDELVIGYAGSFRAGQLMEHRWAVPARIAGADPEFYLFTDVVDSIKALFEANGLQPGDFELLLAYNGRAYILQGDYSLIRSSDGILAIGSGSYHAMSALTALSTYSELSYEDMAKASVQIAANHVTSVDANVDTIVIELGESSGE